MPKKGPLPLFLFSISVQPNKKYANPPFPFQLPTHLNIQTIQNERHTGRERERGTNARTHAVTPVPHEVTTGFSKDMPAEEFGIKIVK